MESKEFSTSPVPREHSIPWWKIAVSNVLFSVCLPTLITGLDLAEATPRGNFISGVVVGSLILTFIAILTSVVGSRTRLSSYMLARIAFGTSGSTLLNLTFALSLIGWFGVNINLFGDALQKLLVALWGYHGPEWPIELVAGLLMTVTTLVGLRAINMLSVIIVPVLVVVCALMLESSIRHGSIAEILARAPAAGMSFGDTVSAVVGGVIVGAVIMPDTCRFIGPTHGAIWTSILTYFVSGAGVIVIGGLAGLAMGRVEILDLMLAMGLGAGAFAIVFGGSWVLNALNLYSAGLSVGAAVPGVRRDVATLVCGIAGTLVAFLQILDHFLTFLFYLSIVFVPVASIIVMDYFLIRRSDYLGSALATIKKVEPAALLAWGAGACVAVLGSAGYLRISGIAAVDAMVVAGVAYGALRWRPGAAAAAAAPRTGR
jgi:cytosine permease